ncbi:MAG: hypothetical protein M1821_008410 [Bathelium mastoideum]|nr:MAG: hypothetical protein M1821_008410 [Bathelium mastoideum]
MAGVNFDQLKNRLLVQGNFERRWNPPFTTFGPGILGKAKRMPEGVSNSDAAAVDYHGHSHEGNTAPIAVTWGESFSRAVRTGYKNGLLASIHIEIGLSTLAKEHLLGCPRKPVPGSGDANSEDALRNRSWKIGAFLRQVQHVAAGLQKSALGVSRIFEAE